MTHPDPDDDHDDAPRPVLSPGFWAALALGLALVLAGATVGMFGARLFPEAHAPTQHHAQ